MANEQKAAKAYAPLLGLSGLFALAAVLSLIPIASARWNNILGYKSLCTFTPISTALCALLAAATCTIRSRLFGARRGEKRPWVVPIVVGLALALVVGFSIQPYATAKADAATGATVTARP